MHTGVPEEQSRLPVWQGAVVGVHGDPLAQLWHAPPLHTCLLPQLDPSLALPNCTQADVPVAHDVLPTLHVVPAGVQSCPAVQPTHAPAKQTKFALQVVPSLSGVVVSVHTGLPPEQSCEPTWQGLVGTHEAAATHALHSPLLQTNPVPQPFPFGAFPVSRHTASPVLQEVCPTRQGDPAMSQAAPALQATHAPRWQTMSVPHEVPWWRPCSGVSMNRSRSS